MKMRRLREKITDMWQNHRRGSVVGIVVGVLALAALYLNSDLLPELWPTSSQIEKRLLVLQSKQELLRKALSKEQELAQPVRTVQAQGKYFWRPERDGDPQFAVRQKVEQAAQSAGVKLKSLGTLQVSKVLDGINVYELNVMADAQLEEIARMMAELERSTPRFYWKNLTLNPDNINRPRFVVFNATVKVVAVNSAEVGSRLWPEKKGEARQ